MSGLSADERERHVCCVKVGRCKDDHFHERAVVSILAERLAAAEALLCSYPACTHCPDLRAALHPEATP